MFSEEEKRFLKGLLSQLQVNPLAADAKDTIDLIKGIAQKLGIELTENNKFSNIK